MVELYDALEYCLEAMERGATLDNALKRFPGLASQLRPLLEASLVARGPSRLHVPPEVRKRGRAQVLRRVHEMEESRSTRRIRMIPAFPRAALTVIMAAALLLTSTGLVSASSGSLPGQQLYPVKRTWEQVRLLLVFNPEQRDLLESDYEQERLDETSELLGRRISAPISFSGLLSKQSDGHWLISGIPVSVDPTTALPVGALSEGAPVSVTGVTDAAGVVQAQRIEMLQPGSSLPPFEPSDGNDGESGSSNQETGPSATAAQLPTGQPGAGSSSGAATPSSTYQFSGVVQSIQGNVWRINGQTVYVDASQVNANVSVGGIVKFQGYYGADGRFVITSIQARSTNQEKKHGNGGSGDSSGDSEGGGESEGGGDGP